MQGCSVLQLFLVLTPRLSPALPWLVHPQAELPSSALASSCMAAMSKVRGGVQFSCFQALRTGLPSPGLPGPALLWCPSKVRVGGALSRVLLLVRGRDSSLAGTSGLGASFLTCHRQQRFPHPQHHMADEGKGQISHVHALRAGSPIPLSALGKVGKRALRLTWPAR